MYNTLFANKHSKLSVLPCANLNAQLSMSPRRVGTEDRNVLFDLRPLLLHNALANPHQVSDLLELQMDVAVVAGYDDTPAALSPRWNWLSKPFSSSRTSFR